MGSVPEDPPNTSNGADGERSEAHPPLPRDKRGWQVAPAPDGRGMPEHAPTGTPPHRHARLLVLRAGADRAELAVGAVLPARRRANSG